MAIAQQKQQIWRCVTSKNLQLLPKEVIIMPHLPMMEVNGHRWMSLTGRAREYSDALRFSCDFASGLTDSFSMDHGQP